MFTNFLMYYQIKEGKSGMLRRIAWALEVPMTNAIQEVVDYVICKMDCRKVCKACRDDSFCEKCPFNNNR